MAINAATASLRRAASAVPAAALIAGALLAVLVLAGCGGDEEDSDDSGDQRAARVSGGGDGGEAQVLTTPSGYVVPSGLDSLLAEFKAACFPDTGSAGCVAFMKRYCGEPDRAPTAFCDAAEAEIFGEADLPGEAARPPEGKAAPPADEIEQAEGGETERGVVTEVRTSSGLGGGPLLVVEISVDTGDETLKADVPAERAIELDDLPPGTRVTIKRDDGGWVFVDTLGG